MGKDKKTLARVILDSDVEKAKEAYEGEGAVDDGALSAIADDLINAVHDKDAAGVMAALKAAFMTFDSEPHEEGPHE